ncbi:MAG: oligosaccharide flippase family protein [Candidatus Micrarchaeaceae archaeon]
MQIGYSGAGTATELGVKTANVASFIAFGKVLSLIIGAVMFIVVARLLGPSGYGIYTLALGASGLFSAIAAFNITAYFNKYIPKLQNEGKDEEISIIITTGILILIAIGIVLSIAGVSLSGAIATYIFHNPSESAAIQIAMVGIIFSLLYGALYAILVSFGDGKHASIAALTNSSFQAFLSIALVVMGFGAVGAISGYVIGLVSGSIASLALTLRHTRLMLNMQRFSGVAKELLLFSAPVTGANIVGNAVSNFSVILLGSVVVSSVVGSYGIALKMGSLIDVITGSISVVLIPMFAAALAGNRLKERVSELLNYSVYFGLLFAVPLVIYVISFARNVVNIFFTSSYVGAPGYIMLLGFGILLGLVGSYAASLVISMGNVNKYFKYSLAIGGIELLSLVLLVPSLGAYGVIIALYFIGGLASTYLYMRFLKSEIKFRLTKKVYMLIIANIILLVVLLPIPTILNMLSGTLQMLVGLAIIIFAYPILIARLKAADPNDFNIIKRLSGGIPIFGMWLKAIVEYAEKFA